MKRGSVSNRKRQDAPESQSSGLTAAGWWPFSTGYLEQSRRPLVSLAFIVPLLATYEGGVIYLGPAALRNGADVWLRHLLGQIGLGQYFLLPTLTVGLLLAWHHTTRQRWRLPRENRARHVSGKRRIGLRPVGPGISGTQPVATRSGRAERPIVASNPSHQAGRTFAIPHAQPSRRTQHRRQPSAATLGPRRLGRWPSPGIARPDAPLSLGLFTSPRARLVGFCGAGIYEEALFRLLLLPPAIWLLGMFGLSRPWSVGLAILGTSLAFSAAHYAGVQGEQFDWFSASFRCLAGTFFATLFVYRGFGIAAGTHALYDVLVGLA